VTPESGLIDTSVVIALGAIDVTRLPRDSAVSTLTMAELASGPVSAKDPAERARRQETLQRAEATFEALPFDPSCARVYARVYAAVADAGRKPRGSRTLDLMIAATALAHGLPLYTLNASDLRGLDDLIEIVDLG
jgi:predicted nucleic acid-binding protein